MPITKPDIEELVFAQWDFFRNQYTEEWYDDRLRAYHRQLKNYDENDLRYAVNELKEVEPERMPKPAQLAKLAKKYHIQEVNHYSRIESERCQFCNGSTWIKVYKVIAIRKDLAGKRQTKVFYEHQIQKPDYMHTITALKEKFPDSAIYEQAKPCPQCRPSWSRIKKRRSDHEY